MTQDDLDNGRLVCLIGVAPVKPAEFVIFRFSQKTTKPATRGCGDRLGRPDPPTRLRTGERGGDALGNALKSHERRLTLANAAKCAR